MAEIENVTAAEAIELAKGETWLVDVRENDEWEAGHAEGAYSLPMSQFTERVDELPKNADLLVICHSGGRSARVTAALVDAGYNAINVAGGTMAWQSAGGVVIADGPAPSPR